MTLAHLVADGYSRYDLEKRVLVAHGLEDGFQGEKMFLGSM